MSRNNAAGAAQRRAEAAAMFEFYNDGPGALLEDEEGAAPPASVPANQEAIPSSASAPEAASKTSQPTGERDPSASKGNDT